MFFKKKKEEDMKNRFKVVKIKDLDHLEKVINDLKEEMGVTEDDDEFSIEIKGNGRQGTADLQGTGENLLRGVSILVKALIRDTDVDEYDIREAVRRGIDSEHIELNLR